MWFFISTLLYVVYMKSFDPMLDYADNDCELVDTIPGDVKLINFTAGGGNWLYQMGIAKFIQEHYDLQNMNVLGTSSGTVAAICLANNINIDFAMNESLVNAVNEWKKASCFGSVNYLCPISITAMQNYFSSLTDKSNHNNRLFLTVSQLNWFGLRKKYLTGGSLNSAAVGCFASAWIPFVTSPFFTPFVTINGRYYVDGYLSGFRDKVERKNMLVINPNIFKKRPLYKYWVWLDQDYNKREYREGYSDSFDNKKKFDFFFNNAFAVMSLDKSSTV